MPPPPPYIYTLSLHDALPILNCASGPRCGAADSGGRSPAESEGERHLSTARWITLRNSRTLRSEEHTSELQSHHDLVCRLLLEKKKKKKKKKKRIKQETTNTS